MCFGPVASFTASGVLASIGVAVFRNIRSRKELLFAAFPILFALQQFIEGSLWLALQNGKSQTLLHGLTFAYLTFAYSLWPALCPISVYVIEYDKKRKKILRLFIVLGAITSLYLLSCIILNPIHADILNCSIRYETFVAGTHLFGGIYVLVTILPYFLSSQRAILVFGVPNLIFCMIAYGFYRWVFISVWCFFAALVSLTLYFFLRKLHHEPLIPILGKHHNPSA